MYVDAPLSRIEIKRLQGTFSAEIFEFVDPLVSSVVAGTWETFGILVRQDRAVPLHGGKTCEVLRATCQRSQRERIQRMSTYLRSNEFEPSKLPPCLLVNDVLDFGVGLRQGLVQNFVLGKGGCVRLNCKLRMEIKSYEVRCSCGGHCSAEEWSCGCSAERTVGKEETKHPCFRANGRICTFSFLDQGKIPTPLRKTRVEDRHVSSYPSPQNRIMLSARGCRIPAESGTATSSGSSRVVLSDCVNVFEFLTAFKLIR